jgi:hypothetical protein
MNINKDLSENDMNLDDDILYQILIDVFSKSEGIVADLTVVKGIKNFVFALKLFLINSLQNKML